MADDRVNIQSLDGAYTYEDLQTNGFRWTDIDVILEWKSWPPRCVFLPFTFWYVHHPVMYYDYRGTIWEYLYEIGEVLRPREYFKLNPFYHELDLHPCFPPTCDTLNFQVEAHDQHSYSLGGAHQRAIRRTELAAPRPTGRLHVFVREPTYSKRHYWWVIKAAA